MSEELSTKGHEETRRIRIEARLVVAHGSAYWREFEPGEYDISRQEWEQHLSSCPFVSLVDEGLFEPKE